MALDPRYCLVPRELRLTAMKILYPEWENADGIHSENLQRGAYGDVVTVPEWTDANNWVAVVYPNLVPGIVVCERFGIMPEVFIAGSELSPSVFMNDEHRIKVRWLERVLERNRIINEHSGWHKEIPDTDRNWSAPLSTSWHIYSRFPFAFNWI